VILAGEESRVPVFVEHVVVAVLRDVILEKSKAVRVNGTDEHRAEPIAKRFAHPIGDASCDPVFKLAGRALGECEATIDAGSAPSAISAATRRESTQSCPSPRKQLLADPSRDVQPRLPARGRALRLEASSAEIIFVFGPRSLAKGESFRVPQANNLMNTREQQESRRDTRRRFEQWAHNPTCQANTISAVHGISMADVATRESGRSSMGQSPFAIARGQAFERGLFRQNADKTHPGVDQDESPSAG